MNFNVINETRLVHDLHTTDFACNDEEEDGDDYYEADGDDDLTRTILSFFSFHTQTHCHDQAHHCLNHPPGK